MVKKKETEKVITLFDKINNFMDKIVDWFKVVLSDEHSDKLITNIVIKIIVGFILLSIIKVLFLIIKGIGAVFIKFIFSPLDSILLFIWNFIIEVSLLIVAVLIIIAIVNKILEMTPKKEKIKTKKKQSVINEEEKEPVINDKTKTKNEDKIITTIFSVTMIVVKVLTILAMIPFIFVNIILFVVLGALVALAINGILLTGAMCIIIGTILIMSALSSMITRIVFKGGNN
jgi:membrane protein implicated in regulation of membrane protease activity